jgi:hypothetical protein
MINVLNKAMDNAISSLKSHFEWKNYANTEDFYLS